MIVKSIWIELNDYHSKLVYILVF